MRLLLRTGWGESGKAGSGEPLIDADER